MFLPALSCLHYHHTVFFQASTALNGTSTVKQGSASPLLLIGNHLQGYRNPWSLLESLQTKMGQKLRARRTNEVEFQLSEILL